MLGCAIVCTVAADGVVFTAARAARARLLPALTLSWSDAARATATVTRECEKPVVRLLTKMLRIVNAARLNVSDLQVKSGRAAAGLPPCGPASPPSAVSPSVILFQLDARKFECSIPCSRSTARMLNVHSMPTVCQCQWLPVDLVARLPVGFKRGVALCTRRHYRHATCCKPERPRGGRAATAAARLAIDHVGVQLWAAPAQLQPVAASGRAVTAAATAQAMAGARAAPRGRVVQAACCNLQLAIAIASFRL